MKPMAWRNDGWPLCPACGMDELAVLETPPPPNFTEPLDWYLRRPLFCYWCARVTVEAGEGLEVAR